MNQRTTIEASKLKTSTIPHVRLLGLGQDTWNRWIYSAVRPNKRPAGFSFPDIREFNGEEHNQLTLRFGGTLPDPKQPLRLSHITILGDLSLEDYVFGDLELEEFSVEGALTFQRCIFMRAVNLRSITATKALIFNDCKFLQKVDCTNLTFPANTEMIKNVFFHQTDFRGAEFSDLARFIRNEYRNVAHFDSCKFHGDAEFSGSKFGSYAIFDQAHFYQNLNFCESTCAHPATFINSDFDGEALFSRCRFNDEVNFSTDTAKKFSSIALFDSVKFMKAANFTGRRFLSESSWLDVKFRSTTRFENVLFTEPPKFQGASLHLDTSFFDSTFLKGRSTSPSDAARAWQILRKIALTLEDHDRELGFFALELEARGRFKPLRKKFWYWLYGFSSGYGRSVLRPFVLLLLILAAVFSANSTIICSYKFGSFDECSLPWIISKSPEVLAYTLSNSIPFAGLVRAASDIPKGMLESNVPIAPLYFVSVAQGIFSAALLFLILLALRNLFRIK